ncbi:inositol monophosphatase [Candidatus Woesearchaeota archaeon]|nr:inositol monophosphatase [Candidatus Woesearchaeota archaeon]
MRFLETAVRAAKQAGKVHLRYFNKKIKIRTKSSYNDRVTKADTESEKAIVKEIKKSFPRHNFLAEEKKYRKTKSVYTWIIDPLDGTNNFSSGMPIFCSSVALAKGSRIIIGVVYNPVAKELFHAEKGRGAYLNGKRIRVDSNNELKDCLLITGFYYNRGYMMLNNLVNIKYFFLRKILGLRRLGSAALDLCNVASARASGFWEFRLNPWDFAAGSLIVEEAGGIVTDRKGQHLGIKAGYVVASNGKIHDKMLKVLNRAY